MVVEMVSDYQFSPKVSITMATLRMISFTGKVFTSGIIVNTFWVFGRLAARWKERGREKPNTLAK